MTIRNLGHMLRPRSVAVVGASPQEGTVGYWLTRNILDGAFGGASYLVNPRHQEILGRACLGSIDALPDGLDLAVIATPARAVPQVVGELAGKGVKSVVCITAGLNAAQKQAMLEASRPACLRILGPNCVGLLLPHIGLNASFVHRDAPCGDLALVSQSGALVTAIIDWAAARGIGFSHVLSIGDMTDVDFGDVLDYLAGDTASSAILLYMEALTNAPKFMSAARRAARSKPVIIVKSGRNSAAAKAAFSHTGALAGSDAAYDAAFRRAGVLRVADLEELFEAAEILRIAPRLDGDRLAILTNGGGAGVLASDRLADLDGSLAVLGDTARDALDAFLPSGWSGSNPVDIIGDADGERYGKALDVLLDDHENDAILVMNCPTALSSGRQIAETVIAQANARSRAKPILTNWLGDASAREGRSLLTANGIPSFDTPGAAARGFMHLVRYNRGQSELMRAPPARKPGEAYDPDAVDAIIGRALSNGRTVLTAEDAKFVLGAYGIPMVKAAIASDLPELGSLAERMLDAYTELAVKIRSDDIPHKSDVGGVRLHLRSVDAVVAAAGEMQDRIAALRPDARLSGFSLEPMIVRPKSTELIIGMSVDETFGPMVMFGAGGTAVEVLQDTSMALPPLDLRLARELMARTRIHALLRGYRDRPAADVDAIAAALIGLSDLAIAHRAIREIDINPLIADEQGVLGLDARVRIADPRSEPATPLSVRPYPGQWARTIRVGDLGDVHVRPIRPEDEPLVEGFLGRMTTDDIRLRLFAPRRHFSHRFIARMTQIDYAREMAFVAYPPGTDDLLGSVRLISDPDYVRAEYAVMVRSDIKGRGLGWALMQYLIDYARHEGLRELHGTVLAENATMLTMCRELGFAIESDPDDRTVRLVSLKLG